MTTSQIKRIISTSIHNIQTVEELLRFINGPTWIFIPGKKHNSCKVIATLLHGNEPSGCYGILRLIKEGFIPAMDTWVLIASVSTALEEPIFSQRNKNGQQDINRCFRAPWKTRTEKLAEQIIHDIRNFKPEAVIDIHNTSGEGPGFAVSTKSSIINDKIAGIFSNSLVITDIKLGALMEVNFNCPIVTIECGGNQSELSHLFAYNGIREYLSLKDLSELQLRDDIHYYRHPLRLELIDGFQLTYNNHYQAPSDLTLCHSIEEQNFGTTVPEKRLGWVGKNGLNCLQLIDITGKNCVDDYFQIIESELYTKSALHLFMVTKNRAIAESDCLFYLTNAVV